MGSRPIKWKKNLQRMLISINVQLLSFLSTRRFLVCCALFCDQLEWENPMIVTCILLIPPLALARDHTSCGSKTKLLTVSSEHIYQPGRVSTREKEMIRPIRIASGVFFTCEKNNTSNQKPQRCVSFEPKFPPFIGA